MEDNTDSITEIEMLDEVKMLVIKAGRYSNVALVSFLLSLLSGLFNSFTDFQYTFGWPAVAVFGYIAYMFKSSSSIVYLDAINMQAVISNKLVSRLNSLQESIENK